MTRPVMQRVGGRARRAATPDPVDALGPPDGMPAWVGKQVPYSKRNDYAPAPADSSSALLRNWWPRPIAWRGLAFVADDAGEDCWRTPRESVDDPWCWSLLHMPYNPEASWAGHLRLGSDRYYGRGHSPAEALEAVIVQARWAVQAVEDALRQVGEIIT